MGQTRNTAQKMTRWLIVGLGAVFCCIAVYSSGLSYRNLLQSNSDSKLKLANTNSKRIQQISKTSLQIESLKSNLSFMVWPTVRKRLLEQQKTALRQLLNLQPYHGITWLELHGLEVLLEVPRIDQIWSLRQALTFNAWNQQDVYLQSYFCLYQERYRRDELSPLCETVFRQLPWEKGQNWLAKKIGVDSALLEGLKAGIGTKF